jgi:hypothetical protein
MPNPVKRSHAVLSYLENLVLLALDRMNVFLNSVDDEASQSLHVSLSRFPGI